MSELRNPFIPDSPVVACDRLEVASSFRVKVSAKQSFDAKSGASVAEATKLFQEVDNHRRGVLHLP